jgi:hypothetical protein
MNAPIDFYIQQAAICGKAAESSDLENQRSKFLRAQKAWQEMADRRASVLAGRNKGTPE